MFVYFCLEQVRNQDVRGPDFFAVLGVPKRERKSWVVWQEGKGPDGLLFPCALMQPLGNQISKAGRFFAGNRPG